MKCTISEFAAPGERSLLYSGYGLYLSPAILCSYPTNEDVDRELGATLQVFNYRGQDLQRLILLTVLKRLRLVTRCRTNNPSPTAQKYRQLHHLMQIDLGMGLHPFAGHKHVRSPLNHLVCGRVNPSLGCHIRPGFILSTRPTVTTQTNHSSLLAGLISAFE